MKSIMFALSLVACSSSVAALADDSRSSSSVARLPTPDAERAATSCEFYVDDFVLQSTNYSGAAPREAVSTWIDLDQERLARAQGGAVLRVGMLANGRDVFFAHEVAPGSYKVTVDTLPWLDVPGGYVPGTPYELRTFSYFIDVQRPDGSAERLDLADRDGDFHLDSVLENARVERDATVGRAYAEAPSPVLRQKGLCAR